MSTFPMILKIFERIYLWKYLDVQLRYFIFNLYKRGYSKSSYITIVSNTGLHLILHPLKHQTWIHV